ncbi:zf-HC2 domain-containing protein [Streptomyces lydicus]|uniref:zf-HC2 domain-containing protein n=1 Tax=Streptomyces lydicus TaxID=47763 RepID=UPI0036CB0104
MLCSRIRTALSARLDGEELPPGLTPGRLDDHLAGCRDCRRWDAQVRALTTGLDRVAAHPAHPADDPAAAGTLLARLRAVSAVPAIPGIADAGKEDAGKEGAGKGNTGGGDTDSADPGGTRTPTG